MSLRDLFANNLLLRWLTRRRATHDLELSMSGVRLGERVAQLGLGDGGLFVALAGKVGYTGRAVAVDPDATSVERARRLAERAGVLVELERAAAPGLALEAGAFDIVVVMSVRSAVAPTPEVLGEALRLLRAGGRCIVVLAAPGSSDAVGAASREGTTAPSRELVTRLQHAGFKASRELAHRDGLAFVEATKAA